MGLLGNISAGLGRRLRERLGRLGGVAEKANRASRVLVDSFDMLLGRGALDADARSEGFGQYYLTTGAVHAAVKLRASAVGSVPVLVEERRAGVWTAAPADHPMARLLRRPNRFWTTASLLRATETYMLLWGSAFWGVERSTPGGAPDELWPLRPDRMRVMPDRGEYIRGFVYDNTFRLGDDVAYLTDEVVWFRQFNPCDEFTGASAISPVKSVSDMARAAQLFNAGFFRNGATPADVMITTTETPTEEEAAAFVKRLEDHYGGAQNAHRPILLSQGMDVKRAGLTHRDMEFIAALKWSVEEVSRVFGVPKAFLSDLTEATFANINAEERFFWRNTVLPELSMIEDEVNRSLTPLFGEPESLRLRFDTAAIDALRESETQRVQRVVALVGAGILTVDEARAREGLEA